MKTIFNTYIEVESQEQADRLKQFCIDNGLPIWNRGIAFQALSGINPFAFAPDSEEFFVLGDLLGIEDYDQVTESEWMELLKQHNEKN